MKVGQVYLDHAATTPMDVVVHRDMGQYCCLFFGNPATLYALGRRSSEAVEEARHRVAELLGCGDDEIYFTSGGTESDNWAVQGTAFRHMEKGKHVITSSIEHHAVLDAAKFLESIGFEVTYVPVDDTAMIDPDDGMIAASFVRGTPDEAYALLARNGFAPDVCNELAAGVGIDLDAGPEHV